MEIKVFKTRDVKTPERGTKESAGLDFFVPNDFQPLELHPGWSVNIPSGIRTIFPKGNALIAFNKSGVAVKKSLQVGACVVDSDYQGEIHLNVVNVGISTQTIMPGDKLVQFIMVPIELPNVEEIKEWDQELTERGTGGFGSTGTK
jgi:dUTP pyrophosphatase